MCQFLDIFGSKYAKDFSESVNLGLLLTRVSRFFFYFDVVVCGITHEDMWITWLSAEAGIKEPFGSSNMILRFLVSIQF
jgi:hypothetical protein